MKDYVKDPCFDCHAFTFWWRLKAKKKTNKQTPYIYSISAEPLTNEQVIMEAKKT